MNNQMTENQITDTPTELDDRDLDLVAGGWGGGVSYTKATPVSSAS